MLMSNAEALHSLYGEISTERDGDLTHQCIQTNLADVICGGEWGKRRIISRIRSRCRDSGSNSSSISSK